MVDVSVDAIEQPERPIRALEEERDFEELCRSLQQGGLIQPLLVEECGERFRVIAGHRRLRAAVAVGLLAVPCLAVECDDEWRAWAMLTENRVREQINVLDEALWVTRLVEQSGGSRESVSRVLGVSLSWVTQRLAVTGWPEDIRSLLASGALAFAVARELAGIKDEARRRQAVRQAVTSGCTVRQAADWRRRVNAEFSEESECGGLLGTVSEGAGEPLVSGHCQACGVTLREGEQRFILVCEGCQRILVETPDPSPADPPSEV